MTCAGSMRTREPTFSFVNTPCRIMRDTVFSDTLSRPATSAIVSRSSASGPTSAVSGMGGLIAFGVAEVVNVLDVFHVVTAVHRASGVRARLLRGIAANQPVHPHALLCRGPETGPRVLPPPLTVHGDIRSPL